MSDLPTCSRCPAWLFSHESIATGLCHGCRSGPPEMRVGEPATQNRPVCTRALIIALADRIAVQSELLSKRAERPRPWWAQANGAEGGCLL